MGKRGPKALSAAELAKRGSWRAGRRALQEAAAASGATGPVVATHDAAAPPEPKDTAPAAPLPKRNSLSAWLRLLLLLPKWDPRAQAAGFRFDGAKARHAIEWFENHVRHLTGSRRGELVRLEPFQRSFLANLFGWVHADGPRIGLRRFTKALLYIGGKNGKALDEDTPIPTPKGWTRMGDLAAGDTVFDEHGRPCRVVAVGPTQTERPCYRVLFSDGTTIVADAEHEWSVCPRVDHTEIPILRTTQQIRDSRLAPDGYAAWYVDDLTDDGQDRMHEERGRLGGVGAIVTGDCPRMILAVDPVPSRPVRCIQVDSPSRLYLAGPGMVPTHNSTLLGGLAAYAFTELNEGGAKVLTAATSRPQARTVWEIARDTICADPPTLAKCVVRHADILLVSDQAAVLKPMSGEAKGEDGAECFFAILDELHRQNDTNLLDILEKGGSTRDQAVLVILTTADEIRESPCNSELEYAKSVRDNPGDTKRVGFNPSYLPAVYELDDGDDWTVEANWYKSNPGLGTIKSLEFMRGLFREAKERRDKRPGFQRLHLNLRVQSISSAIRWAKWEACTGPDDWLVLREKMRGRPCILGGDLAETNDMVALVAWFYEDNVVVPWYWACKAAAEERFRKNEPVYYRWRDAKALDLVEDDAIELEPVVAQVEACTKMYRVMDFGVDAAKAQELIFASRAYGLDPIRVEQGWKTMTEPCDKLTQLVENVKVRHGGHPVLNWNIQNLRWKLFGQSAKKPIKPSEAQKIDGCSAWLTALAVALRKPPKKPSVYETRGVRVL